MMFPPIFSLAKAEPTVTAVFGTTVTRVWPFGEAPAKGSAGFELPYAVWQSISIVPENFVTDAPNTDSMSVQVDVYAATAAGAREGARVLRDLYQRTAQVASMREWPRETDTNHYRYQLDIDFEQYR